MLDAVSGYVAKRIRAKALNAVSWPAHAAAILSAYAQLGHTSVVVPELISALSLAVRCTWMLARFEGTIEAVLFVQELGFPDLWSKSTVHAMHVVFIQWVTTMPSSRPPSRSPGMVRSMYCGSQAHALCMCA